MNDLPDLKKDIGFSPLGKKGIIFESRTKQ